ncbi:MAG: hypothetical protein ACREGL_00445 [Alphaproteobacteria bacterium]
MSATNDTSPEAAVRKARQRSRTLTGVERGAELLPPMPLVALDGSSPVGLLDSEASRAHALVEVAVKRYGRLAVRFADQLSRRWLVRSRNPYLGEIETAARRLDRPGVWLLNLSYEWACTTRALPDPHGVGNRMLRSLDWALEGLGGATVVAHQSGPAGPYYNVTWPGFVGVVTAMAPRRFSAALNQAPWLRPRLPVWLDWTLDRLLLWRTGALPPAHLLRQVFDECRTFAEAKERLRDTPLCLPAIFILSGVQPDEGVVIERLERDSEVHESTACAANHWLNGRFRGRDRRTQSVVRHARLSRFEANGAPSFSWLVPPVLNESTRIAIEANAARGELVLRGFDEGRAVTGVLRVVDGRAGRLTAEGAAV